MKAASFPIFAAIASLQSLDVMSGVTKVLSSSNSFSLKLNFPSDPINRICSPSNIAIDQANSIWIVNNGNNRFIKLTKKIIVIQELTVVVGMATPTQTPMNAPPSLPLIH